MPAKPNRPQPKPETKALEDLKRLAKLTECLNGEVEITCDNETSEQAAKYKVLLNQALELADKKLQK